MNLATIIEHHDAGRVALVDNDTTITFGELTRNAALVRAALTSYRIEPDQHVAVLAGNEPLFISAALGALGVGARVIPMKPTNPLPELERKLAVVKPAVILVGEDAQWIHDHGDDLGVPLLDVKQLTAAPVSAEAPPIVEREAHDVAFMMLTSGVSGDPKVAMLTHGNLDAGQEAISTGVSDGLGSDDVVLGVLPVAHIFGLNAVLLTALRVGAAVILERRFDLARSLDLVRQHHITVLAGAPPMWRMWSQVEAPNGTFSSVRIALSGAAALPPEVFDAMKDRHHVAIEEGYGMTETAGVLTTNRGVTLKQGSVGQAIPGIEIVLVDDEGAPVESGDSGEIVVRGPGIFCGYFDDQDITNQVLTDDGWFWTGDIGVLDDDGHLFIVDRAKDLIIVSGFNVYPAEVENILSEHPGVDGAVVVGGESIETGETVIAHVCGSATIDELDAFAKARLTRYKCPTEYRLVDELPIAPTGKLIRRELR